MSIRHRIAIIVVLVCFALTQFTLAVYLPTLPVLAKFFDASAKQMIVSLSVATGGYAVGQLVWGSLSDKIGRKPVYIIALLAYLMVCGLLVNVNKLDAFYAEIGLLGFCAAAFTSVGNAFIVDLFGIKRAGVGIAYVGITMATASVLSPLIGSYLETWFSWRAVYGFLAIVAFLVLIGMFKAVRKIQINTESEEKKLLHVYRLLLSNPHYLGYLLTLGLSFGCFFTYLAAAPFIYKNILQATLTEYGWLFLLSSITYVFGSIYVSRRIINHGINKLLKLGLLCFILGGFLLEIIYLIGFANRFSIVVPVAIFLFGVGIVVPASKAGAMTIFDSHRGTAASLMKFTQIFITTIITAIAAQVHVANSILLLGLTMIIVALLAYTCLKFFILSRVQQNN